MNIQIASAATVVSNNRNIKVVSALNPETKIIDTLSTYLSNAGYSEMFPNFDTVNIGAVHPFALLLFQELNGDTLDLNVFPSITVADASLGQEGETLSDEYREIAVDYEVALWIQSMQQQGTFFVSDTNMAAILAATVSGDSIVGIYHSTTKQHTINFSLWAANRDVTSLLFDLTLGCLLDQKATLKDEGVDSREVSGSRTGDINMDFGQMLYGSSASMPVITVQTVVSMDIDAAFIDEIIVNTPGPTT